jgi:hypothetical protein
MYYIALMSPHPPTTFRVDPELLQGRFIAAPDASASRLT